MIDYAIGGLIFLAIFCVIGLAGCLITGVTFPDPGDDQSCNNCRFMHLSLLRDKPCKSCDEDYGKWQSAVETVEKMTVPEGLR